jgi:hypothetical protein
MNLFGIALRKPSFNDLTAATVLGVGLWILVSGLMQVGGHPLGRADAGAALLVSLWACVGARLGIRIDQGTRHFVASLLGSAVLLALYEGAQHVFSL